MTNPALQPYTVLIVDSDARRRAMLRKLVSAFCFVQAASTDADARAIMDLVPVHVVLTREEMHDGNGVDLCAYIAERFPDAVRIVYGGSGDADRLLDAINRGQVWRYLPGRVRDSQLTTIIEEALSAYNLHATKSAFIDEMRESNEILRREVERYTREILTLGEELHIVLDQMQTVVATDELTGLLNRRAVLEVLDRLTRQTRRYQTPVSCIVFEITDFEELIVKYGHEWTDALQQGVAERVRVHLRDVDYSARIGEGAFTIVLPMTQQAGAMIVAERLYNVLSKIPYNLKPAAVTVRTHIGVAEMQLTMRDAEDLFCHAQNAAYAAQRLQLSPPIHGDEDAVPAPA